MFTFTASFTCTPPDSFASMQEQQTEQHHSNILLETRSSTNFELPYSHPNLVQLSYQSPGEYQGPPPPLLNQAQAPYPPQNYTLHVHACEEPLGFWHDYDFEKVLTATEEEKKHSQERAEELQESLMNHGGPIPKLNEQVSQKQQQLPLQSFLKPIGSNRFHCVSCPRSYKYKHHLKDHEKTCARRLQQQQPPLQSLSKPIGSNMFQCGSCPKSYKYKQSLNFHIKQQHDK